MPVIAVVNRKGGSGKSTLATHLAAWCARRGHAVMLGDTDRQQSSRAWLRRREPALPAIQPWAQDNKQVLRVPAGISHVVLDTPGGLHGFELARIVMCADAIVMPVAPSVFDREAAAACYAELMTLPRVTSGRCRVAAIGMRVDRRTQGTQVLEEWASALDIPFVGVLRETQIYVRALERGLTVFDLAPSQVEQDIAQWQPILDWLAPAMATQNTTADLPIDSAERPLPRDARMPLRPAEASPNATADMPFQRPRPSILDRARADRHGHPLSSQPMGVKTASSPAPPLAAIDQIDIPQFLRPRPAL